MTVVKYENILPGVFISRQNRFIAHVEIDEKVEICHVKRMAQSFFAPTGRPIRNSELPLRRPEMRGLIFWR